MVDISFTIVMQWINFGILLFLLYHLLFKPLLGFLDKRSHTIAEHIAETEQNEARSLDLLKEYEAKLKEIRKEAEKLYDDAHIRGEKERGRIMEEALQSSKNIISAAKDDVIRETEKAKQELTQDVSSLVIDCAAKVLGREIDEKDHRKFIKEFIDSKGA